MSSLGKPPSLCTKNSSDFLLTTLRVVMVITGMFSRSVSTLAFDIG